MNDSLIYRFKLYRADSYRNPKREKNTVKRTVGILKAEVAVKNRLKFFTCVLLYNFKFAYDIPDILDLV